MIDNPAFLAFLRWIIFGVANNKKAHLFVDAKNNDLVIHAFLVNRRPPIHREQSISRAFGGFDEAAEFVRVANSPKGRAKMQNLADRHLVQGLLFQLGYEGRVAYGAQLCDASGEVLTDLDAYLPSKRAWIELTTTVSPNEHLFEKLGKLSFIGHSFSVKERNEDDPKTWLDIPDAKLDKIFYLSLYPITYHPDPKAAVRYEIVHIFEHSDADKVTAFLVGEKFLEKAEEKFNEITKALKSFLEI
jgi:hypothetical protein